jgi:hypothetical protein
VKKDQPQPHRLISVHLAHAPQVELASVQQAPREGFVRSALLRGVKYAVFVQRKTSSLITKSLVRFASSLPSAARSFLAGFQVTVQHISVTLPKPSSVPGTLHFCRSLQTTP